MSSKIDGVPRELLERLQSQTELSNDWDEVQALLAAPVVERQQPFAWYTEGYMTDKSATTYDVGVSVMWGVKGWPVTPLYASPPAPVTVVLPDVDVLAQIIRTVDGNHSLGAGALAERILEKVKELNQ